MLNVTVGRRQTHANLTLFPLLAPGGGDLSYVLLADAQAAGTLEIGEVGTGTVPSLMTRNTGDQDVLVLDGEQLVGCRQNRMTNRSLLLPAQKETQIPVYCMEQGRWSHRSDAMAPAPQHSSPKLRRHARDTEYRYAMAGGSASVLELRESQGEIWDDIAQTASAVGAASHTGAFDDVYAHQRGRMDSWLDSFPVVDEQVGALVFVAGRPLALDLIGSARLYGRVHGRLLRGYVMDAIERMARERTQQWPRARRRDAHHFLATVRHATRAEAPTVGRGRYSVLTGAVVGGELADDGTIAHLSAFPLERDANSSGAAQDGPVAPPSLRRHHWRGDE